MFIFRKPHPYIFNRKSVVIPGVITFLMISIFAPFGFRELEITNRLLFGLAVGLLTSLSIVMVVAVAKKLFPELMIDDKWTVGKEMILFLSVVATICLLVFGCFILLGLSSSSPWTVFKQIVVNTIGISVIPITILVLYEQYIFQKQSAKLAIEFTKELNEVNTAPNEGRNSKDNVLFEAENGKVELQVPYDRILYLKSDGNYVEVFYLSQDDIISKKLIRNRLKRLLNTLPRTQFFHAHKSYIVNTKKIEHVVGNARNFELVVRATDDRIPVSRSKSKELILLIKSLH